MQNVITVNLNGNAYQLDADACDALRAYLGNAEAQLGESPDKTEVVADLEQAIAEKCRRFLGPHKTVITLAEIDQVLREIGPVEAAHEAAGDSGTRAPKRRLYRIREGRKLAGVCNGLAAYFSMDPTVMRIIFILLTLVTQGYWVLVYILLMFVMPVARTSEERAAAQGLPFTAQELVDSAKKTYSDFRQSWRRQ